MESSTLYERAFAASTLNSQKSRTDHDNARGPTKWGRPLSSAAVGGVLWQMPQHPTAVKAEERRRQAMRALTAVVPGGRAPRQSGQRHRGRTKWGRPLSSAAVGGVLWRTPQHPTAVK